MLSILGLAFTARLDDRSPQLILHPTENQRSG
jgi:hypothetical protein